MLNGSIEADGNMKELNDSDIAAYVTRFVFTHHPHLNYPIIIHMKCSPSSKPYPANPVPFRLSLTITATDEPLNVKQIIACTGLEGLTLCLGWAVWGNGRRAITLKHFIFDPAIIWTILLWSRLDENRSGRGERSRNYPRSIVWESAAVEATRRPVDENGFEVLILHSCHMMQWRHHSLELSTRWENS